MVRRTKFPDGPPAPKPRRNGPGYAMEHVRRFQEVAARGDMHRRQLMKSTRKLDIDPESVASYWLEMAMTDVREFTPKFCCRYCYGVDGLYQYTHAEHVKALRKHVAAQLKLKPQDRVEFDDEGGSDFDKTKKPNPECKECRGLGVFDLSALDFDKLSDGAALLYDGVVIKPNGSVELKLRDRSHAMMMLQRLKGYEVERKMVLVRTFDPSQLEDSELATEVARLEYELENPTKVAGNLTKSRAGTERE